MKGCTHLARGCTLAAFIAAVPGARATLLGLWKFDEAAGTVAADSSGQTPANGTLTGGAVFQPGIGKFGGAVYLNGASAYVDAGDTARFEFPAAQSFSVACWYKSDGDETTAEFQTNNGLVTKGYHTSTYDATGYYQLQFNGAAGNTNSFFQFDSRESTALTTAFRFPGAFPAGSQDVVNNAWHHFVAVMDRGSATPQCRLYLDNVLYATQNFSAAAGGGQWPMGVNTSPLIIGNHFGRFTKGWMDDVGIWDQALTVSEVASIYTGGIAALNDSDGDGLADSWEMTHWSNLAQTAAGDFDSDGLTNGGEFAAGSNPKVSDTDGDGLSDNAEVVTHQTSPVLADTDSDGLNDGAEINTHLTNPKLADTDGDGWNDGAEITAGTNPLSPTSFPPPAGANVHINEFVSENLPRANDPTAPADIDAEYPDWLELRNNDATAVNLNGWQLSDDPANPGKWKFASTSIAANGYLVVFASGKNRSIAGVQPHTNFKLPSSGSIILSRPDGAGGNIIVSQIGTAALEYPGQKQGVSYGREGNTFNGALKYFTTPTPGAANNAGSAVTDFVSDTHFSVDRGLYTAPVSVTISCATPGSTLSYTFNGSAPTPTNGTQVPPVDALTPPTVTLNITSTTLLRARAWKTGMGSSNIDTQSYLFPANVMTQNAPTPSMGLAAGDTLAWGGTGADLSNISAFPGLTFFGVNQAIATDAVADNQFKQSDLMVLPTLSLVADWKNLFGSNVPAGEGGIYPPASGLANEGVDRPASLEFINPTGSSADPNTIKGFQSNGNIHVFGGTSQNRWKSYKLSLRFQCNRDVNYRLYGDDATNSFANLTLDATMNNTWMHPTDSAQRTRSAFVRDFVMADLQNNMGQRGFHSKATHLYINGLYWGIYYLHEKPDHHFAASYYGGDSDDYDAFKHSTHPGFTESDPHVNTRPVNLALPVARSSSGNPAGNSTCVSNFEAMLDLLGTGNVGTNPPTPTDLTVQANYDAVAAMLDIDAFIDYMMLNFVGGNQDWADKNLYAFRNRINGKWRFFSWDAEHVFRTGTENFIAAPGNEGNPPRNGNPKQIHNRLRTSPEYRMRFADRIRKHMFNGGALTVAGMTGAFNSRLDEISNAVRAESARWGHIRAALNGNVPYKRSNWLTERNRLTTLESGGNSLIQNRWNLYMNGVNSQFRLVSNGPLYPSTEAPSFSQHGGSVASNYSLTITNPNAGGGTVYYTLDGSDPRLAGGAVSGAALTYSAPVTLASSTAVKSRVLLSGVWSALNEAYFSVATVPATAANIVVSEFNYNPGNPTAAEIAAGYADANDFEFVELQNISSSTVDLRGCRFTAGLTYSFNNGSLFQLAPGARLIIAENAAAFAYRYGAGRPVAGVFELDTGLSNSGETLTLAAADNAVIKSFAYNDKMPWPEAADGQGYSLVLIHPELNPDHTLAQNWRPSVAVHGSPGGSDVSSYASWKTAHAVSSDYGDDDRDGASNVTEYLLRTDPASSTSRPVLGGGMQSFMVSPGPGQPAVLTAYFTLTFNRNPAADDVTYLPEISSSLGTWSHSPADIVRVSASPNPDGTQTEVWRSATPASGDSRRFGRVLVTVP